MPNESSSLSDFVTNAFNAQNDLLSLLAQNIPESTFIPALIREAYRSNLLPVKIHYYRGSSTLPSFLRLEFGHGNDTGILFLKMEDKKPVLETLSGRNNTPAQVMRDGNNKPFYVDPATCPEGRETVARKIITLLTPHIAHREAQLRFFQLVEEFDRSYPSDVPAPKSTGWLDNLRAFFGQPPAAQMGKGPHPMDDDM